MTKPDPPHRRRRPRREPPGKARRNTKSGAYDRPRLDPQLKQTFSRIGVPEPTPFKPDPFQLEALEKIKDYDVLVSAPTGSGKTWIASEACTRYLSEGKRVWYASPLKALSNSIYLQFCQEFGAESCGILTGDRKVNPDASITVGTTEILRNQLYDAMHEGTRIQADLVILDEAHYLSDPDRGVVWEEVLIYLTPRVRLLLLSATISNAEEICAWMEKNRGTKTWVVRSTERAVPLEMLFLFPDGLVSPLAGRRGLTPRVKKFMGETGAQGRRRGSGKLRFGEILRCLREFDLLPAIFFLKSRSDCNWALQTCTRSDKPYRIKERLKREVRGFLKEYPHLEGHRQMDSLLECMVVSHHAGQLPYWKVLIEKMMNKGYLDAIFSTSTVAAGVNFPARTVVLVQSDRYNGREFANLTATDLHQMIGRAGRRGKDHIGFALVVPGLHQDPQLIYELRDSPPEPLISQIRINFSMTLNLLLSHTPLEVKDLLKRSFASFQERKSGRKAHRQWDAMLETLKTAIPEGRCDIQDPHEVLENIQKRSEFQTEARELATRIRYERRLNAYRDYLKPGRLLLHKNKGIYVLFHTYTEEGDLICAAHNIKKVVKARKKKIQFRKVPFEKIRSLFDYRIDLPEDYASERLQALLNAIRVDDLEILDVTIPKDDAGIDEQEAVLERLNALPCEDCEHQRDCHAAKSRELRRVLRDLRSLAYKLEGLGGGLWLSFNRHLRFLKETGFVDDMDRLTPDGEWASQLRLDHPLLIAEAIRKGGFDGISPEIMASGIAPFVWDRVQEVTFKVQSPLDLSEMEAAFQRMLDCIEKSRALKVRRGFENPLILSWPATALFLWAKGVPWDELLSFIAVDEGDMASLMVRTSDHLRQVANLKETHPELASVAREAIDLILREPVFVE